MPKTLVIGRAQSKFREEIISLDKILFSPIHWDREGTERIFETKYHETRFYFCISQEETLLAYGGYEIFSTSVEITDLAVSPQFRGRRYGELLLLFILQHAYYGRHTTLGLHVKEDNKTARSLYEKVGFRYAAFVEEFYEFQRQGFNSNAWSMEIDLLKDLPISKLERRLTEILEELRDKQDTDITVNLDTPLSAEFKEDIFLF